MAEGHNGRASPDIGTINAELPSDDSTMTASSIQLGNDQEKTQPLEEQTAEQFVQENHDPEKAGQVTQNAPAAPTPPSMPPDGGWEAWLVVLGAFCSLFVSFGWINCELPGNLTYDQISRRVRLTKNKCRYWRLPGLLPDSSVEEPVSQYSGMGSIIGDVRHVRWWPYLRKGL